ncbi:hypothetical protein LPB86_16910 [Pedobacter sp. MC2016-14]|uniref:hypothetical protein n=1 Tax=Pedobacter sp. MC2016-14 TaxID=2897327 RepID=UPI001E4C0E8C|nr:hypothetical protein [Pedobacter sp. MC2016-14]MCD0489925.1 hypothetical protein [Pedobacter sp. MC2016-14]
MKSLSFYTGILLVSVAITSCQKELEPEKNPTLPSGYGNISFVAKASSSKTKVSALNGIKINNVDSAAIPLEVDWSSATVYVEKITFTGKSNNLLDTTVMVEKNLDLLAVNSIAGNIKLPSGSYKDVEVKMYCKKFVWPELAFFFKGTFKSFHGTRDSIILASSLPFQASLRVPEIVIKPVDKYKATFNFNLINLLSGFSLRTMESAQQINRDGKRTYSIFKGGSENPPLFNELLQNWQNVTEVLISKD